MEGAARMRERAARIWDRRRWALALVAAAALSLVFASGAAAAQTGVIEGKVTDAVSEAGVQGVEVCALQLEEVEGELEPVFAVPPCTLSGAEGAL